MKNLNLTASAKKLIVNFKTDLDEVIDIRRDRYLKRNKEYQKEQKMPEHTPAEQRIIASDIRKEMSKGVDREKATAIALSNSRKRRSLLGSDHG